MKRKWLNKQTHTRWMILNSIDIGNLSMILVGRLHRGQHKIISTLNPVFTSLFNLASYNKCNLLSLLILQYKASLHQQMYTTNDNNANYFKNKYGSYYNY